MILSYKIIKFLLPWVGKICLLNHYNENITTKVVVNVNVIVVVNVQYYTYGTGYETL